MSTTEGDNRAGLVPLTSDRKDSNALVQRKTHSLVSAPSPLISRGLQQLAARSQYRIDSQLFQGDRGYLDVSPYGTVVTHSMDGKGVEVFDVQNPAKAKVLPLPACEWPGRFSWSHDGSHLVVGALNAGMLETTHAVDMADDRYLGVLGDSFVSETPCNEGSDRYLERIVSAWGWGREYGENKGIAWAPTGEFVGITEGWHKAPLRLWHLTGKSVSFVANFDFEQSVDDMGLGHLRFVGNNRLLAVPPVLRPRYLVWLEVPSLRLAERIALPGMIVRSTIIDSSFSADGKQAFFCTGAGAVFVLGTESC